MNKFMLRLCALVLVASAAYAGPERYSSKDMKQTAAVQPFCGWYADNEWNVSLWGTYAFTGNNWSEDRYIESDHAWGGGIDAKYFFHRYFGLGVEGFILDARRQVLDEEGFFFDGAPFIEGSRTVTHERRAVGSVMGTFTLRYPIGCSRFAPYIWVGGGAMFGGGERDDIHISSAPDNAQTLDLRTTVHSDNETKAVGQFGGGFEVRVTPHLGWTNDISWNVVDGTNNNFGMARSGINFAF